MKDSTAKYIVRTWWLVLAVVLLALAAGFLRIEKPPESKNSPFSEECKFYQKTQGGDMVISEPSSGTFRYELIATSDGIEVWKCNAF